MLIKLSFSFNVRSSGLPTEGLGHTTSVTRINAIRSFTFFVTFCLFISFYFILRQHRLSPSALPSLHTQVFAG